VSYPLEIEPALQRLDAGFFTQWRCADREWFPSKMGMFTTRNSLKDVYWFFYTHL